ncbi:MAG: hypothetical protein ACFFAN_12200 [Promethearchaeota archaeon]
MRIIFSRLTMVSDIIIDITMYNAVRVINIFDFSGIFIKEKIFRYEPDIIIISSIENIPRTK